MTSNKDIAKFWPIIALGAMGGLYWLWKTRGEIMLTEKDMEKLVWITAYGHAMEAYTQAELKNKKLAKARAKVVPGLVPPSREDWATHQANLAVTQFRSIWGDTAEIKKAKVDAARLERVRAALAGDADDGLPPSPKMGVP